LGVWWFVDLCFVLFGLGFCCGLLCGCLGVVWWGCGWWVLLWVCGFSGVLVCVLCGGCSGVYWVCGGLCVLCLAMFGGFVGFCVFCLRLLFFVALWFCCALLVLGVLGGRVGWGFVVCCWCFCWVFLFLGGVLVGVCVGLCGVLAGFGVVVFCGVLCCWWGGAGEGWGFFGGVVFGLCLCGSGVFIVFFVFLGFWGCVWFFFCWFLFFVFSVFCFRCWVGVGVWLFFW